MTAPLTLATAVAPRPRVLCVDDEVEVLEGIRLNLRRHFDVMTAASAPAALALLERSPGFAVVMSDLQMPGVNGIALLSRVRTLAPEATRLLLTGQSDHESAVAAVNEGQIFRFLQKPCPSDKLLAAVKAAAEQHALVTAERVLLEETLQGCIRTLTELLALVHPKAFGRALRLRRRARQMVEALSHPHGWKVEVAAMLSQLGWVNLPEDVVDRLHRGGTLTPEEAKRAASAPATTEALLAHIPRLEDVRAILTAAARQPSALEMKIEFARASPVESGARILRAAAEFDSLELRGETATRALEELRAREPALDPVVLTALADSCALADAEASVQELPLAGLRPGMVCAADVQLTSGMLLVTRGFEVNATFLERVRHYAAGTVKEPVRVFVARPADPSRGTVKFSGFFAKEGRAP